MRGYAPRLRSIFLDGIPFLELPTLLIPTSDLVELHLYNIPRIGYISPEAMVAGLAALPRLRTFHIGLQLATHRPDRIHPSPVARTTLRSLPALSDFAFMGAREYLEDLVARIDTPHLDWVNTFYLNQVVDFQLSQLSMYIDRSVGLKLTPFKYVQVTFDNRMVTFQTHRHANDTDPHNATTYIYCRGIDWQVSHLAQVVSRLSATLSNVVHLKIEVKHSFQLEGTDGVEWIHLLHQSPTVQTLHVSHELAGHVALALEDVSSEAVAESLPSFDLIYVAGRPASSIDKFLAARQLSGRAVTVIDKEGEFFDSVESYVSE